MKYTKSTKIPAGEYIITTIKLDLYRKRRRDAEREMIARGLDPKKQYTRVKKKKLESWTSGIFRITRKSWSDNTETMINQIHGILDFIPNILIDEILTLEEAKKDYPEYWL